MRYKVTVSYDGKNYVGFQSQKNGTAIQDVIEKAIKRIFLEDIRIIFASRTDSKVHAYGQVFQFDSDRIIDCYKLKGALNNFLPDDIHIVNIEYTDDEFHCRYMVKEKTYRYLINTGEYDVFLNGYAYQCSYNLDLELMKQGAKLLIGTHDFGSFNTTPYSEKPNQVRTISVFDIRKENDLITITVTGTGFLRNMVRIMVGCLIELSRGKKSLDDIKNMISVPDKGTRRYNISGSGLYLVDIKY